MRRAVVLACACLPLVAGTTAQAHRIDEYLQASLITVQPGHIDVAMRLVPGEQVAPAVIAAIDRDANGTLSADEQRAYARRVLADLVLTLDGAPAAPTLLAWDFPSLADLRAGLGDIHLSYAITLPGAPGAHALVLVNRHMPTMSVYLANVVPPRSPAVVITGQDRNAVQSVYRVDFRIVAVGR